MGVLHTHSHSVFIPVPLRGGPGSGFTQHPAHLRASCASPQKEKGGRSAHPSLSVFFPLPFRGGAGVGSRNTPRTSSRSARHPRSMRQPPEKEWMGVLPIHSLSHVTPLPFRGGAREWVHAAPRTHLRASCASPQKEKGGRSAHPSLSVFFPSPSGEGLGVGSRHAPEPLQRSRGIPAPCASLPKKNGWAFYPSILFRMSLPSPLGEGSLRGAASCRPSKSLRHESQGGVGQASS